MIRLLGLLALLLAAPAQAQTPVSVIGTVVPGHCATFFSTTQIQDGTATGCGLGSLGTMAFQNANNVNITGGTITGMPTPASASDVATKNYVDNSVTNFTAHAASLLATAAALPTNIYANGTAGVGATLTATTNAALTVDGIAVSIGNRIVVKNEAAAANNGIYTVTQTGSGSAPYILTRATDANTPGTSNPNLLGFGTYSFITSGTSNINTGWQVNSSVSLIGSSPVNWVQFNGGVVGVSEQKNTAGLGLVTSGNCDNVNTNATSPCQTSIAPARLTLPTTSIATTAGHTGGFSANGSGTYTAPANVLWIEILLVGGGGGGYSGANTNAGGSGGATCWNTTGAACTTPVYSAGGGPSGGNTGGAVSGSGTCILAVAGGAASWGNLNLNGAAYGPGGNGGSSSLGGAGGGGYAGAAFNAAPNSGSGGGGGSATTSGTIVGGIGGASGATCKVIISSPAATYTYTVGAGGSGGAGAANGFAGGAGAGGQIVVIEHYGS